MFIPIIAASIVLGANVVVVAVVGIVVVAAVDGLLLSHVNRLSLLDLSSNLRVSLGRTLRTT
jgi:hypothetical protein